LDILVGMRRRPIAVAAALASFWVAADASANGQFPAADLLVVHATDPTFIVARTTFGLLATRDAGQSWGWICEGGAGYSNYEPPVALTGDGTLLGGYLTGLAVSRDDLCDFGMAGGVLESLFVTDVAIDPLNPSTAVAVSVQGGANVSRVWISTDDAGSWTQLGVDLPAGFLAKTLDVAPGDASRVYVSGTDTSTGVLVGRVGRTDDGGASWEMFDVPGSGAGTAPYIGAIDPADPDVLYVRLDGAPGKLLVSEDAGESYAPLLDTVGFLKAFALSPDGATVLAGGDIDGLWSAPAKSSSFEKASDVGARCLRWDGEKVYACADAVNTGFSIGVSTDGGHTFAPLLDIACLTGPLDCAAGTTVGDTCPDAWPAIDVQLGECTAGAGGGGTGAGGGSTDAATSGAGGGASATSGATSGAGGSAASGGSTGGGDGCECALAAPAARVPGGLAAIAAALGLAGVARRRRR
jgi:hypothetical protein